MSQTLTSLARLTLRQLRQIASDLGVPLYSRKSKEALVGEVAQRQVQPDAHAVAAAHERRLRADGRIGRGARPSHFTTSSGGLIRKILQDLEEMVTIDCEIEQQFHRYSFAKNNII